MSERPDIKEEGIYYYNNEVAFIYIKEKSLNDIDISGYKDIDKFKKIGLKEFKISNIKIIKYPWDIIKENSNEIKREFSIYRLKESIASLDIDIID